MDTILFTQEIYQISNSRMKVVYRLLLISKELQ
jgi:hypothetical protein